MALSGLVSVSSLLVCPIDGMPLAISDVPAPHVRCSSGHCFDVAKQGYVNLLTVQDKRSKDPGDTKEMIAARARVLNSGVYEPLAGLLLGELQQQMAGTSECVLLDAGCGEGYYLDYCYQALKDRSDVAMIGLDISKWAVMAATKRCDDIGWLVASNRHPPIKSASVDVIICGFGFPDFSAFRKILKPGGCIIMLDPAARHLLELREIIYPVIKPYRPNDFAEARAQGFSVGSQQNKHYQVDMNVAQIQDVLVMSPHLYKASAEGKQKVTLISHLNMTVDVVLTVLRISDD